METNIVILNPIILIEVLLDLKFQIPTVDVA